MQSEHSDGRLDVGVPRFEAITAIDYSSLSLVPRVPSGVVRRADVRCDVALGEVVLDGPLIASPMPDVSGPELCTLLADLGCLGILHRFQSLDEQVTQFAAAAEARRAGSIGAAVGIVGDFKERFVRLYEAGCRVVCLDTANGAHTHVVTAIDWVKRTAPEVFVIAGNVASGETFKWLEDHGADAIRVGIAGGALCETRTETGVYAPTPQAVMEAASVRTRALVIGDGGVRRPGDLCLLLALGADAVMLGSELAGTSQAAGREITMRGKRYKIARGAASQSVQIEMGRADPAHVEGAETMIPYRGDATAVVQRYLAGLRSSMAYMDARTLAEYRANARFLRLP